MPGFSPDLKKEGGVMESCGALEEIVAEIVKHLSEIGTSLQFNITLCVLQHEQPTQENVYQVSKACQISAMTLEY